MSSVTIYGLKNCDTCRKALKWLDANDVDFEFKDVRADGVDRDQVAAWVSAVGAKLLNTRSTTWRQLSDADRERAASDPVGLLVEHPTLIKRPVLDASEAIVGFDEASYRRVLKGVSD